ncbi:MAG: response regulator transcription factor [Bacteroidetes bacterium]|nr:response regulator transcription factor [Bacteroidota bacterium]
MPDKKLKLLIADDHRLFIEGLRFVLKEEFGIEIAGFVLNGKEAIEQCKKEKFDVVLMDINMPVIDGIEATREIKRLNPEIKIIIISMLGDLPNVTKAINAGADAFVLKNADSDDLMKAFQSIAKNEIYVSESITHFFTRDNNNSLKTKKEYIQFSENVITPREQSVLKLIVEGYTNQQIADTLFISVKTADTHRKNMLAKLNLPNTASLVKFAIENKLV